MFRNTRWIVGALAAALWVAPAFAGTGSTAQHPGSAASGGEAARTLAKLHAGNEAEIQAGRWMQDHAQSSKVKDFAKKMVKDHGDMDKDVMALAQKKGIDLTRGAAEAEHANDQHALTALQDMAPAQAERHYMSMMVKDHQHDVSEVNAARQKAKGSDQELASLLDKTAKKMEDHLKDAQKIERDMTSRQARNPKQ